MTNRERIFATFNGAEVDRYPVWLKMANRTWQNPQPEPYRSMEHEELLRATGCDLLIDEGLRVTSSNPHIAVRSERSNGLLRETIDTPDGELISEQSYDPYTQSWHPTRFPIASREDLAAARWIYCDTTYTVDDDAAAEHARRQRDYRGRDIVTMSGIGPSPLMQMIEHDAGPVNTIYLAVDHPKLFSDVIALMHADRMRLLNALLPRLESDTFWLSENTSTSLISPKMFRDVCMEHLRDYGNLILDNNIEPVHHMCGTLNALLEMIDELPATVNEAYTTRPLGDVSLAEGRRRMPSKALVGGTNATLLTWPLDDIMAAVESDLADCPDKRKIFLTSAGVLPAPVSFDKARRIVDAFKSLKAS